MARNNDPGAQHVTELLAERRKLEQWLARLDEKAESANSAVTSRVRGDYRKRLDEVTEELGQYGDGLRKQRDTHAKSLESLRKQESVRAEAMAEAELRHTVGEYTEAEWKAKRADIQGKLETIRTSIAEAESAMANVDEVLGSLSARPEPEEEPAPAEKPTSKKKSKGQTEAFGDELEFLKSVSDDDADGPSAGRASGSMSAIPEPMEPPKNETPVRIEKETGAGEPKKSRPSMVNQRTLKCKDCGSLNLPTEWYCEKCGAELAAV